MKQLLKDLFKLYREEVPSEDGAPFMSWLISREHLNTDVSKLLTYMTNPIYCNHEDKRCIVFDIDMADFHEVGSQFQALHEFKVSLVDRDAPLSGSVVDVYMNLQKLSFPTAL
ncbi:hypothetical protein [Vibrio phage vB_VmeM-Yong XC32]|nr:hypothetical protein [Vibrio phage vB_VmeM-Yong XC31]QAX96505.1 hypothetical protein [Vibrio phage vB_VmeM-Yong XC32]QAX96822.1 hypothetical protein [Vibrio phage vB_VmeM-Yong MS31]QAX97141.1 hypothetical protein [Vibrio phage vB_VmeM-Yong MS32]